MSISRKNWSALSSLTRQWTVEDEEEVEREKRRRVKSSSTTDPDSDSSLGPSNSSTDDSISGTETSDETSKGLNSTEQMQLDFVEMLRVRDEKRRLRHVETLRRQKEEGEDNVEDSGVEECDGPVGLLGELDEEKNSVFEQQTSNETSTSSPTKYTSASTASKQNEELSKEDCNPHPKPLTSTARKFVSSVSISLDIAPSASGRTTPMSPCSPLPTPSPREPWPSLSRSSSGAQSPVQNGHPQETSLNGSSSNSNFEQATKPAFVRQSSRTISFRMMKKKEEESAPAPPQRSASVRITSKKVESNTEQYENEDKPSSFQRNSRQRISSRSIQEKMERLAQAAQKSELTRSPDVSQRTLVLLEEVSRKRSLFEKDQPAQSPKSPGEPGKEPKSFSSGMSYRINRWLNKSKQPGSSFSPTDLRHVDITSKKTLFEKRGEESVSTVSPEKNHK